MAEREDDKIEMIERHTPPWLIMLMWLRARLTQILYFSVLALAGFAAWVGVTSVVSESTAKVEWYEYLFIFCFVFVLTFMINHALKGLFRSRRLLLTPFFILLYVALTCLNVTFGFGFFYHLLNSSREKTESAEIALNKAVKDTHNAQTHLTTARDKVKHLATLSEKKREDEGSHGGTCEGDASQKGLGPRKTLREAHARAFKIKFDDLDTRLNKMAAPITELDAEENAAHGKIGDERVLKSIINNANSDIIKLREQVNPGSLKILADYFKEIAKKYESSNFSCDEFKQCSAADIVKSSSATTEKMFQCHDHEMSAALDDAAKELEIVPELGDIPIPDFDKKGKDLLEAFGRLSSSAISLLSIPSALISATKDITSVGAGSIASELLRKETERSQHGSEHK